MNINFSKFFKNINHKEIIDKIAIEGVFSWRIAFFTIISSGIAILGLLTNSSAAIIGAMLISPLMGPIISLGFAIATLNIKLVKSSCLCIAVSSALGIFVSFIIVFLSPLSDITPEIIARTNPNLFDLLIAIFSAIAAGYAFIKQQESSIVGVVIAVSLMPPLSVVGFGLATGNSQIAKGSFFLFMTNLLAICITIFSVSKMHGFKKPGDQRISPALLILGYSLLLVLSYPLSVSLKDIAYQSYAIKISKNTVESYFAKEAYSLNSFSASFDKNKLNITAVVGTKYYKPAAKDHISKKLEELLNREVNLKLAQVAFADEKAIPPLVDQNKIIPAKVSEQEK